MKVLLTAAAFSSAMSGVQRHAFNLVRCLLLNPEISEVHLAVAPWQTGLLEAAGLACVDRLSVHVAEMKRGSVDRNLWHYYRLPRLAAKIQADLVHLSYPVPIQARALGCPSVVTLHDLYPYEIPQNFGFPQVLLNRLFLQQCLRSVEAVACVSDTTMARLTEYMPAAIWRKAVTINNCIEAAPRCIVDAAIQGWEGEKFLLCIAQHRRNKNIALTIRAFDRVLRHAQLPPSARLVVVGIAGPETRNLRQLVGDLNLGYRVLFLEGLSEAELQWCYARCEALVVPSQTEGFGLPVAEALLAGCPVVCSDIDAFREVGEGRCHFISLDGDAAGALANMLARVLQLPKPEPIPLPHLSSEILAPQYAALYRRLVTPVLYAKAAPPRNAMTHTTAERGIR